MPPDEDVNGAADTIVVGGDYSEDSAEGSDDSFDAYGGEGEGVEEQMQDAPETDNDDYAKTFDSPPGDEHEHEHENQGDAAQPPQSEEADVSMASESMNNSSAPDDTLKSGSPSASTPVPSSLPPSAVPQPTNGATDASSDDSSDDDGHQSTPSHSSASASPSPASLLPGRPSPASPAVAAPEATDGIDISAQAPAPASPSENGAGEINIEKLVDDITAGAANPPKGPPSAAAPEPTAAPATATPSLAPTQPLPTPTPNAVLRTLTVSPSASLPPKPVSHHLPNHSFQNRGSHAQSHTTQRGSYMSTGPPGVTGDGFSSLPPPPPSSYGGPHAPSHGLPAVAHSGSQGAWETFLADEKRYTSDGNWERFPEGSRIFIGNLSSERVTKREVYDVFSKFGRLAQISLKNAYGFVQYHTVAEGDAAVKHAQDMEMGGRKIHLEISRTQKKTDKGERERSPERRGPRGERGPRPNERFEGREPGGRRDDYRSGRSPSPRRHDHRGSRDGFGPRDRVFAAATDRRRSRSPPRFGRFGPDSYRTRSRTPPRHAAAGGLDDLPRRHGSDVPDVQFLAHDVSRDFVDWLQRLFRDRGLKTDVMLVSPNFPRQAIVERQILEGVHGIVEIDHATQQTGKLSIQVFKRPGGSAHVQYDLYQDLEPSIAAELVVREKQNSAPPAPAPTAAPIYPPQYANPYAPDPRQAGYGYGYPQAPAAPPVQAPPAGQIPGFPGAAIGQLDNNALQALLASLQQNPPAAGHPSAAPLVAPVDPGHQAQQVDIHALLGNLRSAAANQAAPMPAYGAAPNYGSAPVYPQHGGHAISPTNGTAGYDTAQHVQSIMEQLHRASH